MLEQLWQGVSAVDGSLPAFLIGGLIGGLVVAAGVAFLGRTAFLAFRLLGRALRAILRPLTKLFRRMRLLPRAAAATRPSRHAALGATSTVERAGGETETHIALHSTSGSDGETIIVDELAEGRHIKRNNTWFRSLGVPASYFPSDLTGAFTDEVANAYQASADQFFSRPVQISSNHRALFDDIEAAAHITLMRDHDHRCFYALDAFRRVVNANIRTLALSIGALHAVLQALLMTVVYRLSTTVSESSSPGQLFSAIASLDVFSTLITCVILMALIYMTQHFGYSQQQRNNVRELTSFLARYMSRLSDRYRESTAMASRVTIGDETDGRKLSEMARRWHKIMMWIPFRAMFIEFFIRNMLYQMRRNREYYDALAYGLLITAGLMTASAIYVLWAIGGLNSVWAVISIGISIVAFLYAWRVFAIVVLENELNQAEWLGFNNMDVSVQMDNVVGKYAEDVGFWKRRGRMEV